MRFLRATLAASVLTACAAPAAVAPSATAPAAANPGAGSTRAAQLLAAAGTASAPTMVEIERTLGAADISRREGAGAALTYRLDSCALLLLFAADARNAMRLQEASASARRTGPAPSLEQCAAEVAARRD